MNHRTTTFRPQLESLESRFTPAGNVTAQLIGDTLVVNGDQFDNWIVVVRDDEGVHLFGVETSLNGQNDAQLFQGVNNIVMDLGNGDDFVDIPRLHLEGNLDIDTGAGSDFVHAYFLRVGGDANIRTGANGVGQREGVVIERPYVDGTLFIDTGEGEDLVELGQGVPAPGLEPPSVGNLVVDSGNGNDLVEVRGVSVPGTVLLQGGNGNMDALNTFFLGESESRTILGFEE